MRTRCARIQHTWSHQLHPVGKPLNPAPIASKIGGARTRSVDAAGVEVEMHHRFPRKKNYSECGQFCECGAGRTCLHVNTSVCISVIFMLLLDRGKYGESLHQICISWQLEQRLTTFRQQNDHGFATFIVQPFSRFIVARVCRDSEGRAGG